MSASSFARNLIVGIDGSAHRPSLVLVTPVLPGDSGYGLRMRTGLLLEGLAHLGPVHVIVIPVLGQPADFDM
ncbi:MAG TPA: hypothetical protein VHU17_08975, partial [Acidimicrobiales bacterium]|nr:hypothetical protein [Acidimicrobiales bacterium]